MTVIKMQRGTGRDSGKLASHRRGRSQHECKCDAIESHPAKCAILLAVWKVRPRAAASIHKAVLGWPPKCIWQVVDFLFWLVGIVLPPSLSQARDSMTGRLAQILPPKVPDEQT